MNDAEEYVVLVDAAGREVGAEAKLAAHRSGRLHRAVSVFVFDDHGAVLLQRRSAGKYHSAGRWSNTACGHPRPGETTLAAARRRLAEEMGLDVELREVGVFTYRAELGAGLVEHERDHLFVGTSRGLPIPDPHEVDDWRWVEPEVLTRELAKEPERFSAWLPMAWAKLLEREDGAARSE